MGEMVMHKDSAEHGRTTCKCRIVQCELCGKDLQENEREHHQTWKCRKRVMLCGFGCGKQFIADRKNHHYRHDCQMRFVECSLGCGVTMRAHEHTYHVNHQCMRR